MWSHYANYHKGFCLEYDIKKIPYGDYRSRFLYPVIYSDQMFDATEHMLKGVEDDSFNNIHLSKSALVKACDWSYEREWRLVFSNGIFEKEQSCLMGKPRALYLGTKIIKEDQDRLIKICMKKDIPYKKMKIRPNRFCVEPASLQDAEQHFSKKNA